MVSNPLLFVIQSFDLKHCRNQQSSNFLVWYDALIGEFVQKVVSEVNLSNAENFAQVFHP